MKHGSLPQGMTTGLSLLTICKLFERLGYYGLRAIFVLYLVDQNSGLAKTQEEAIMLYGVFTFGIVAMQFIGACLADFLFGTYRTLILGCILTSIGYLSIAVGLNFYFSLLLICIGNGCFIPSHWGALGQLFNHHKSRLDGAVSFVFIAGYLGGFFGVMAVYNVTSQFSWATGFALAAGFQLISMIFMILANKHLPQASRHKSQAQSEQQGSNHIGLLILLGLLGFVFTVVGDPGFDSGAQNQLVVGMPLLQPVVALLCLIVFALLWWFKAVASLPKLIVAVILYGCAFAITGFITEPAMSLAIGFFIILGVFEALSVPIMISVVLQNANQRYISINVFLFTLLPPVLATAVVKLF